MKRSINSESEFSSNDGGLGASKATRPRNYEVRFGRLRCGRYGDEVKRSLNEQQPFGFTRAS